MMFVQEWGKELEGSSMTTEPIVVIPPAYISQIPSTYDVDTPPSAPETTVPQLPLTTNLVVPSRPSDKTIVKSGE
ncbi:hypothetical protein Dimus_033260, partial [Dionaea muscipula]